MAVRGKKPFLVRKAKEKTNNPKPFLSTDPPRPRIRVVTNNEGQIKTFDASSGTHKWLGLVTLKR